MSALKLLLVLSRLGGAGGVGEGVVRVLLAHGATVVATARTQAKLDGLAVRVDDPR